MNLRTNELEIGTWVIKTRGNAALVQQMDSVLAARKNHWLVRETRGALRRTLARLDGTGRPLMAWVGRGRGLRGHFAVVAVGRRVARVGWGGGTPPAAVGRGGAAGVAASAARCAFLGWSFR